MIYPHHVVQSLEQSDLLPCVIVLCGDVYASAAAAHDIPATHDHHNNNTVDDWLDKETEKLTSSKVDTTGAVTLYGLPPPAFLAPSASSRIHFAHHG